MKTQMCSNCKQVLPLNEVYFGHNPQSGFRRKCRRCKRAYDKEYGADNIDARNERNKMRVNRESIVEGGGVSQIEKTKIRNLLEDTCAYCRIKLDGAGHFDHKMPIAKMGADTASNITLACKICNLQKHAKNVLEFKSWRQRNNLSTNFHPSVYETTDISYKKHLEVDTANESKALQPKNWREVLERVGLVRDRENANKTTQILNEADQLRQFYFSLSKEQLAELWNDGANELEGEERVMAKIAYRNSLGLV